MVAWALALGIGAAIYAFGIRAGGWVWPARVLAVGVLAGAVVWFVQRCKATICDLAVSVAAGAATGAAALAGVLTWDDSRKEAADRVANGGIHELMIAAAVIAAVTILVAQCTGCRREKKEGTAPAGPIDQRGPEYFFRYTTRWMIALLVLAVGYSALYGADCESCPDLRGIDPVGGILPLAIPWFGALGATTASLYGIMRHAGDWQKKWNYWHLARPIVGTVLGSMAFLIFFVLTDVVADSPTLSPPVASSSAEEGGTDAEGTDAEGTEGAATPAPEEEAEEPSTPATPGAESPILFYVIAFLVGYRERTFQELVTRLADIVLKPGGGDGGKSDEPAQAGGEPDPDPDVPPEPAPDVPPEPNPDVPPEPAPDVPPEPAPDVPPEPNPSDDTPPEPGGPGPGPATPGGPP